MKLLTYYPIRLAYLFLISSIFSCNTKHIPDTEFSAKILESFELADGFQIELIAHEPLVADPVAMEIDEYGRMYVVQMHGYPLDKSGSGSVRLLSDTDGDGVMDQGVTFAEGLTLPNGIMRWKKGIVVTDAPNLLYFEDTDGDGQADVRDTLLTGFALSNPQHKLNSPIYGLDNWIYLANEPITAAKIYVDEFGDPGEQIRYPNISGSPLLPKNANGRRVRLRPDRAGLEMLAAATQFSNAQDVWGRHFLGNNTNHIFHEVIQASYLNRNKYLEVPSSTQTISDYGMPADVYPITENPEHQIFTSIGVFTSACGVALYGGGLFPEPFDQVAFVAEPVSNLVHATSLEEDGASFKASRLYESKEFLASKDSWFRPVNHYIGPDGALYVVDYHRRFIEHPEWMGEDIVNSGALYDGKDKGRIYRITPKGTGVSGWTSGLKLGDMPGTELVKYLSHSNAWYRRTAQRLLVDRSDKSVVADLKKMVLTDSSAYGRLHAAWTMEGLDALTLDIVMAMLKDKTAGVRENGIRLAELLVNSHPQLIDSLLALKKDENAHVRFQLLCSLGGYDSPELVQARQELLFENIDDKWMQVAALSAQQPDYKGLIDHTIRQFDSKDESYSELVERLTAMYVAQNDASQAKALISRALDTKDRHQGAWQSALLAGLARRNAAVDFKSKDFEGERLKLMNATFGHSYPNVRSSSLNLLRKTGLPAGDAIGKATERCLAKVTDQQASVAERQHSIVFLSISNPEAHQELFYSLLGPNEPLEIQKASLKVLGESGKLKIAHYLRDRWKQLSPQLRDQAIGIFIADADRTVVLIEALEERVIDPSSVSFYRQIYLMTLADEKLKARTRNIFKDESKDAGRKEVIESYSQALAMKGEIKSGKSVFEKNCATCHQIGGKSGTAYGPDLGTIRNRKPTSILTDILDPALSIADGFDLWEIQLTNGESRQGVIRTETPTTIALNIYGGPPEVISRQQIESMRALGVTIMPSGLEGAISKQEMSDLLAFLKKSN